MALDTFKAQLKAYLLGKKVNLSQTRIDAFAAKLDKKNPDITDVEAHDTAVADMDELLGFADIAKQDDKVRTLEAKAKPQPTPTGDDADDADTDEPAATDKKGSKGRMPEWFKPFAEKFAAQDAEKAKAGFQAKLKESLKDIPQGFYKKWALPEKEEDLEAFEADVKAEWEAFTKENPVQPQSRGHQPQRSSGSSSDGIDPDLKAYIKKREDQKAIFKK